jgi:ferritin-like metal-binding protein YciE
MKKVIKLSESDLSRIITRVINEQENTRYMFFSNLEQMRRQCDILLEMDKSMVEEILENGHDWAQDHISEAKNNMDQVFDFLMNETKSEDNRMDDDVMMEGSELTEKKKKNKPTNPGLWQQCLAWAKQRYEVCPSAYCNGAAVKRYNSKGGKWKKG